MISTDLLQKFFFFHWLPIFSTNLLPIFPICSSSTVFILEFALTIEAILVDVSCFDIILFLFSEIHLYNGGEIGRKSPGAFADELHGGCVAPAWHPDITSQKANKNSGGKSITNLKTYIFVIISRPMKKVRPCLHSRSI